MYSTPLATLTTYFLRSLLAVLAATRLAVLAGVLTVLAVHLTGVVLAIRHFILVTPIFYQADKNSNIFSLLLEADRSMDEMSLASFNG